MLYQVHKVKRIHSNNVDLASGGSMHLSGQKRALPSNQVSFACFLLVDSAEPDETKAIVKRDIPNI